MLGPDRLGRSVRDLRISVTDRCNMRCTYCMPKEAFGPDHPFLPRAQVLTYEEIARFARIMVRHGVRKVRITGGEPLLRRDLDRLVGALAAIDGLADLALTTNGVLLGERAASLRAAGLRRVTVSLDSLDDAVFRSMNGAGVAVATVLAGIDAASRAGLGPLKINTVVRRGVNDQTIVDLARHFRGTGHVVRFIEYMDVGSTNGWRLDDVLGARQIVQRINAALPLEPVGGDQDGAVARRWRYRDGGGEIGVIASVSEPFCRTCTRLRLSPEGRLYTCLFAAAGHDLRALLRAARSDEQIGQFVAGLWRARDDRYSERRTAGPLLTPRVEMSYIGG
jgi:cyclic pyranopterin phosphate synthase